jgi:hypothetical protein
MNASRTNEKAPNSIDKELTHTRAYIRTNRLSCSSCTSSREQDKKLWCMFGGVEAVKVCRFFEYEPGTDEHD